MRRVADAVEARLLPRLLCIGEAVTAEGWQLVSAPPWDGVLLASLSAAALLRQPDDAVCTALLTGKPVFLRESGLEYRRYDKRTSPALWAALSAKERSLRQMGVQPWAPSSEKALLTAEDIRRLQSQGLPLPRGARLTPLARDLWEGRP